MDVIHPGWRFMSICKHYMAVLICLPDLALAGPLIGRLGNASRRGGFGPSSPYKSVSLEHQVIGFCCRACRAHCLPNACKTWPRRRCLLFLLLAKRYHWGRDVQHWTFERQFLLKLVSLRAFGHRCMPVCHSCTKGQSWQDEGDQLRNGTHV